MPDEAVNVVYTVKELLAVIDKKIDTVILSLGNKAERHEVDSLSKRVSDVESQLRLQEKVNMALRDKSASDFTRREKLIGAFLALAAVAVQIYFHIGG